jgi:hypothetical protein
MPDSFIDKLRMNGIFSPGNQNPVGPPDLSAGGINLGTVTSGIGAIQPYIQQAQDKRMRDQQNMMLFQHQLNDPTRNMYGGITPIGNSILNQLQQESQPKQQTIMSSSPDQVTPYQKEMLKLQHEKLKTTDENTDAARKAKIAADQSKTDLAWDKSAQQWDKNDIARGRLSIADFKAKHPNEQHIAVPGGNLMAFDPRTGKYSDSGIPSGLATSIQQIDERGKVQSNLENQRFGHQQTLQDTKGQQQLDAIGARIQGQQDLQANRPLLPNQQKTDMANKANQLKNERPDLAPFIEIDSSGRVNIAQPSGNGWFEGGPSLGTWSEINSILNGGSNSTNKNSGNVIKSPTTSQGINTSPSSKYKVGIED